MINWRCLLYHKWGKWQTYEWIGGYLLPDGKKTEQCIEFRQKRHCVRCGIQQDREINES